MAYCLDLGRTRRWSISVIALDPGVTTGWAYWSENLDLKGRPIVGQVVGMMSVWELLMAQTASVVVCEGFYYQRRDKVVLTSKEVIGIVKLWCHQFDKEYVEQTPSMGKKFWSVDKVKKLGLWVPRQVHAMDALRHLLYYMTFTKEDHRWLTKLTPVE